MAIALGIKKIGLTFGTSTSLLLVAIWGSLIIGGFAALYHEQFKPVAETRSASTFPSGSAIALDRAKPSLILFVHPHCPCTEATFRQLDQLLAAAPRRLGLVVVFALPAGVPAGWEQGDLLQKAEHLPGCRVFLDKNEVETARFNIIGSGHVLVYSTGGKLLFSGGITSSRGHDGDNLGRSAITSLALYGQSTLEKTPVFGCTLR